MDKFRSAQAANKRIDFVDPSINEALSENAYSQALPHATHSNLLQFNAHSLLAGGVFRRRRNKRSGPMGQTWIVWLIPPSRSTRRQIRNA
jgi:hypothetical protein